VSLKSNKKCFATIRQTKYHAKKEMVSRGSLPFGKSWPPDPDKKLKKTSDEE